MSNRCREEEAELEKHFNFTYKAPMIRGLSAVGTAASRVQGAAKWKI
jgi:hypothetical protein